MCGPDQSIGLKSVVGLQLSGGRQHHSRLLIRGRGGNVFYPRRRRRPVPTYLVSARLLRPICYPNASCDHVKGGNERDTNPASPRCECWFHGLLSGWLWRRCLRQILHRFHLRALHARNTQPRMWRGKKSVFFVIRGSHVIMSVSLCGSDEEPLMYKYLQKWSVVDPSLQAKVLLISFLISFIIFCKFFCRGTTDDN